MSVATATELWRMSATELAEAIRSRQALQSRSHPGPPAADRGGEPRRQRGHGRPGRPGRSKPPRQPTARSPPAAMLCRRSTACRSPSRGTSTWSARRRRRDSRRWRAPIRRLDAPVVERLRAAGAIPIGRTNLSHLHPSLAHRQRTVGSDHQPVGPVPNPRRLQRRRGRGPRHRHEPVGAGQRRARIAALAGPMLRDQRAEAHPGPHPARDHHRAGGLRRSASS